MRLHKNGNDIRSVEDWFKYAPPAQGLRHWKDGQSAKEFAKAWIRPAPPPEFSALMNSRPEFVGLELEEAIPEHKTELDEFSGPRHNDLLVLGQTAGAKVVICIEAKA